jgi:hypothetical protein
MKPQAAIDAYVEFFENLNPAMLDRLDGLCAPDVRFRDPFNDVTGASRLRAVLAKMFRDVDEPRFQVTDRAFSDRVCYLRWTFTFRNRGARDGWRKIVGVSEIHLNAAGRVVAHLDHWDAGSQVYEHLPLLGALVRIVKRRLSAAG